LANVIEMTTDAAWRRSQRSAFMTEERVLSLPYGFRLDAATICRHPDALDGILLDLYDRLRPAVLRYVSHLTGSTVEGEDVLQLAFLRLFDALQQGKEIENARGWIYRVAHNLALDQARSATRHATVDADWFGRRDQQGTLSPEDTLIRRQAIRNALTRLNDRERYCLLLRADGLRYQEIADVLGVSPKAVSVYLARGLKKFAKDYDFSVID
jgi:RNA polymerase sigma-70 factor (ECF subfamily)